MDPIVNDYTAGISNAYLGELAAAKLYRALALRSSDPLQREKFDAVADIEDATARTLAPVARRLGIEVLARDIEARARERFALLGEMSFATFIEQASVRWPPFITLFENIANMAPPEDSSVMEVLVAHERALVRFVEIERAAPGSRESLEPLKSMLAHGFRAK
jgi:hypothetical protein